MTLPAYWWLLALAVTPQGALFARMGFGRMRGKGALPVSRIGALLLFGACAAGGVYAVVQRDPLFFLGQACLTFIYYRALTTEDD